MRLRKRDCDRETWSVCLTQAGRGVDMTIRGAVSGRMKRTKAWMVESRASSDCGGNLRLGCRELEARPDPARGVACRRCVREIVAMMSTMVWLSVAEW